MSASLPPAASATSVDGPLAPLPWLVADIGGTNARFAWVEHAGAAIEHGATVRVADHTSPLAAAQAYLAQRGQASGSAYRPPRSAAWAIATPVVGDRVELTNAGWSFSQRELRRDLGLDCFLLLNDFEALALALPHLAPEQLRPVGAAAASQAAAEGVVAAARAVIGPGTGLGVAGLLPCPGTPTRWLAVPGEGGHASLAAADDFESLLLAEARRHHEHVSAERLLSGIGLPALHQAVAAVRGLRAVPLDTADIVAAGLAEPASLGADPVCRETLEHFCALLGGFAGNVALTLGARGGLYIGGGIVPRLGEFFFRSRFRERFEAKGRFESYLRAIPTWLIVDTRAALTGAVAALRQHA